MRSYFRCQASPVRSSSEGDGVVHFAVGEGFVTCHRSSRHGNKRGNWREVLFEVDAEAGLGGAWMTVSGDVGGWVLSVQIGVVGLP